MSLDCSIGSGSMCGWSDNIYIYIYILFFSKKNMVCQEIISNCWIFIFFMDWKIYIYIISMSTVWKILPNQSNFCSRCSGNSCQPDRGWHWRLLDDPTWTWRHGTYGKVMSFRPDTHGIEKTRAARDYRHIMLVCVFMCIPTIIHTYITLDYATLQYTTLQYNTTQCNTHSHCTSRYF